MAGTVRCIAVPCQASRARAVESRTVVAAALSSPPPTAMSCLPLHSSFCHKCCMHAYSRLMNVRWCRWRDKWFLYRMPRLKSRFLSRLRCGIPEKSRASPSLNFSPARAGSYHSIPPHAPLAPTSFFSLIFLFPSIPLLFSHFPPTHTKHSQHGQVCCPRLPPYRRWPCDEEGESSESARQSARSQPPWRRAQNFSWIAQNGLLITHQVIENYWNGKATAEELQEVAKNVRKERWQTIQKAGVDIIPS